MKHVLTALLALMMTLPLAWAQDENFPIEEQPENKSELSFIGYYFMRQTLSNIAPTNEFLKGQVVGRLFGGNTTATSDSISQYGEQRFMPMFTYSPRLFDGWAKMRASFELDWTWGDGNYGAGGNYGGAFGADFVNLQTQNLFIEFRPQKNLIINAGLLRLYDNIRVPYYTPTASLTHTGFRLGLFGSDASGIGIHYSPRQNLHTKFGAYQLWENNVEQKDDVVLFEAAAEYDLDVVNSVGLHAFYLRDNANGEGGVSVLGQGLNSGLSNYNGVFNFDIGNRLYKADIIWVGAPFHGNELLNQGRFGYNGYVFGNYGLVDVQNRANVDVLGFAANLRMAYKYGRTPNDRVAVEAIYSSGDDNNVDDNEYSGVLTGNNWTSPGAVFFSHGLYLLMPHGNVVNRYFGAVQDIQNIGYGLSLAALHGSYDLVPNKLNVRAGAGIGFANADPSYMMNDDSMIQGGRMVGTEFNFNLRWTVRVFMDLELHAAYLALGDFYETPATNGWNDNMPLELADQKPDDPWTVFATLKWIMF